MRQVNFSVDTRASSPFQPVLCMPNESSMYSLKLTPLGPLNSLLNVPAAPRQWWAPVSPALQNGLTASTAYEFSETPLYT